MRKRLRSTNLLMGVSQLSLKYSFDKVLNEILHFIFINTRNEQYQIPNDYNVLPNHLQWNVTHHATKQ